MTMRIVYLVSAAKDLAWIRHYYSSVFPAGKGNAEAQFHRVRLALLANPMLGKASEFGEAVRELTIPQTPFSYVYRIRENRIEVLRALDNRAGSEEA